MCTDNVMIKAEHLSMVYKKPVIPETMDHLEKLKELENCMVTKAENKVKISFSRQQINPAEILLKVMKEGYHVKDFTVLETSLEDAIRTIYRNTKKGVNEGRNFDENYLIQIIGRFLSPSL